MGTAETRLLSTVDSEAAADFLIAWLTEQVHLNARHPDRKGMRGRTFQKSDRAGIVKWIKDASRAGFNIWFAVNNISNPLGPRHPRANKDEIASVVAFHLDNDCPHVPAGGEMEAAKIEQIERANAYKHPPSMILDSGGGTPCYWILHAPVPVTPENIDHLEGINRQIAIDLERPDGTFDITRIMRVPFTRNVPDKVKRERGRVAVISNVRFDASMCTYGVEEFASAPKTKPEKAAHGPSVAPDDVPEHVDIERACCGSDDLRKLIVEGARADKNRSDEVYYASCLMREGGLSDAEIISVIVDHDYKISDHIHDAILTSNRTPVAQAQRTVDKMNEKGVEREPTAEETFESVGDQTPVGPQPGPFEKMLRGYVLSLDPLCFIHRDSKRAVSKAAFDAEHIPLVNSVEKLPRDYHDHAAKYAMSRSWLKRLAGICYRPGQGDICTNAKGEQVFNMWIDPKVPELQEEPTIFLYHIKHLFPDERDRKLALQCFAYMVKHPGDKIMFAIYIIDAGGTGKSWLGLMFEMLFGSDNVVLLPDDDPIKDMFNGYSENKQLVVAEELVPGGNVSIIARLKGVITSLRLYINEKYIPRHWADNRCNVIGFTNEPNAIKVRHKDRRALILRGPSDPYGVDENSIETAATRAHFTELFDCLYEGGTAGRDAGKPGKEIMRIKWWLTHKVDLSDFNAKSNAPMTEMRAEIADTALDDFEKQIMDTRSLEEEPFDREVFAAEDVIKSLRLAAANHQQLLAMTQKAMHTCGCRRIERPGIHNQQIRVDGAPKIFWARNKKAADDLAKLKPAELAAKYKEGRKS